MGPNDMNEVIGGMRYNTAASRVLAGDDWWDGHNFERHGHNTYLFVTKNGRYFAQHLTQWQGERDYLEPLELEAAKQLFEGLPQKRVDYTEAFPDAVVEDA